MSLFSEIMEQPQRLDELIAFQRTRIAEVASQIQEKQIRYIFLAARGTSDNAGRYANYLFGGKNQLPLALATPSLFTHYKTPPNLTDALVMAISQSGQSPDILEVVKEGREQNCLTIVLTNDPASPLAKASEIVLDLHVGAEKAVAATKTYTAELLILAMLSAALNNDDKAWNELLLLPDWIEKVLQLNGVIKQAAERYRYMQQCVILGRGYNYSTSFEWALKLKELAYVGAEPYSSADFMHGPIAMIHGGFPVMAVVPAGKVQQSLTETLYRLKNDLHAELVLISNVKELESISETYFPLPSGIPEWLSPIPAIVAGQLFAYHLTYTKGYDPEQPRIIHKITETV